MAISDKEDFWTIRVRSEGLPGAELLKRKRKVAKRKKKWANEFSAFGWVVGVFNYFFFFTFFFCWQFFYSIFIYL